MATTDDVMNLQQLARYIGFSPRTVYLWAQQEKIPGYKFGSSWRFRVSEIDEWMEEQRTGPPRKPQGVLSDPIVIPRSKAREEAAIKEAEIAMITDCQDQILKQLSYDDPGRGLVLFGEFVNLFGEDIVNRAVRQLVKTKRVVVENEVGLEGRKVAVIKRRTG